MAVCEHCGCSVTWLRERLCDPCATELIAACAAVRVNRAATRMPPQAVQPPVKVADALADIRRGIAKLDILLASGAQPAAALSTARQRTLDAISVLETATAPTATPGAPR